MPLYEDRKEAENKIELKKDSIERIAFGTEGTVSGIIALALEICSNKHRPAVLGFDGWYGVDWKKITALLNDRFTKKSLKLELRPASSVYLDREEIEKYRKPYVSDDPSFGVVNQDGRIEDLFKREKLEELKGYLQRFKSEKGKTPAALIVYGPGAAVEELSSLYDLRFYSDFTRQPLLWQLWDGALVPFGMEEPDPDYGWKAFYYCDYYLLNRHKRYTFENMDYWIDAVSTEELKLIPSDVYREMVSALLMRPIKQVPIFQPGPWGGYRYKDIWNIPGLGCSAWNLRVGPELSVLVDAGSAQLINVPFDNLMQFGARLVGPLVDKKYPGLFPLDVWLEDGYFPEKTPSERTSMPLHNHPDTEYVKRHFNEPVGRYETYYIAEAYEGANIWLGYSEDANLEEWEEKCRISEKDGKPISKWKDFIANWSCSAGELYLIPPGTVHAHGGNMMVLEMDTTPSVAGTEYSFFLYDYVRKTWDEKTKTMTGKPLKLHLEHGFNNEKWRREEWVKENLVPRPRVIKWTADFWMDRFDSGEIMPVVVERLYFKNRAEYDTGGKFMHIVTLAVGECVTLRSADNPEMSCELKWFQSAVVPAGFGAYELLNEKGGLCTMVIFRWKEG